MSQSSQALSVHLLGHTCATLLSQLPGLPSPEPDHLTLTVEGPGTGDCFHSCLEPLLDGLPVPAKKVIEMPFRARGQYECL